MSNSAQLLAKGRRIPLKKGYLEIDNLADTLNYATQKLREPMI